MASTLVIKTYPGMGRGLYSTAPIKKGAIVEVSPVIPLTPAEWKLVKNTRLEAYVFAWGSNSRGVAVPLGLGGLFNHSDKPNVSFWLNLKKKWITFRARKDIPAGEQLTIDYLWSKKDRKKFGLER